MARLMKESDYRLYMTSASERETDRHVSPRAMQAYLQYRLYLVEAQIGDLAAKLSTSTRPGVGEQQTARQWAWAIRSFDEEKWASWTRLNYLLSARALLKRTLQTLARSRC